MGVYSRLVKSDEPRPKKRLGQHFLRDTGILDRIIRWIQPNPGDLFVDIGAGDGALSVRLADKAAQLVAIEMDGDILQLDLAALVAHHRQPGQKLRIAGNLPYNIATVIIGNLLHGGLPIDDLHFMVQLEVAARITAHPSTRQYGYLSVDCQHFADVRMGFKVSPACFVPRPKVSSAMISLRPKSLPQDPAFESCFEMLIKAAFAYRRKTLENSLHRNPQLGPIAQSLLSLADIDGSRRAEELSVQEYEKLAGILHTSFPIFISSPVA
jgi:16S rRNA (adenine1518-N6/adenine1519-N6)-dimethyltransferase